MPRPLQTRFRRRLHLVPFLALAVLSACKDPTAQANAPAQPPPASVSVVVATPQPVPITIDLPGRTNAFRTAEVRPQVNGVIRERSFNEGEAVEAGQQLYQIDPSTYEAALASARAAQARAEAAVVSARSTVARYRPLVRARAVSQQDLDNAVATLSQAEADVASGQAAVQTAEINLQYTKVTAPISGRTSRSSVTVGALVTANQTSSLVSITQLDPIYVDMPQPASSLMRLRRDMADGTLQQPNAGEAEVKLTLDGGIAYPHTGKLQFSEVIVAPGTSSVTLRALFPNPDGALMPGLFVHGEIQVGVNRNAILVPQQGITRNQRAQAVAMVVKPDGTVEPRIVTTGQSIGDQWLVTDGLQAGDRVVVEGNQRQLAGTKVTAEVITAEELRQHNIGPTADRRGN